MLCYEADRDPAEGVPDEVFDVRFGDVESNNGNLPLACAQLGDLAVSCNPMLDPVDGIDGQGHRTVNTQVDRQDGVAIPINIGQLIQARLVLDSFGVVGGNGPPLVVEARVYSAKHCSAQHRSRGYDGTFPRQGEPKVSRKLVSTGPVARVRWSCTQLILLRGRSTSP